MMSAAKPRNPPSSPISETEEDIPLLPPQSDQLRLEDDGSLDLFKKPHNVSLLILAGGALFAWGLMQPENIDIVDSTRNGVVAVGLIFLLISALYLRDGPYVRPHPAFWRAVQGASIIYACLLTFMVFQPADTARLLLQRFVDPSLNVQLPERDYAVDCRVYTPEDPESSFRNVRDNLFDVYVAAHFFGWIGKTLIFKDVYLAVISGTIFEFMEYSLQHFMPNFAECWWDKLILDLFGANALGILCGYLIMKYYEMHEFNWIGFRKIKGIKSKVKRAVLQITPRSWDAYRWGFFRDGRGFFYFLFLLFMTCVCEFNAFALKQALWIPSDHYLNVVRLVLWFLISAVSFREVYQFVVDPTTKKLGSQAWLALGLNFLEIMVWIKYLWGDPMWQTPTPQVVKYGWLTAAALTAGWGLWYFKLRSRGVIRGKRGDGGGTRGDAIVLQRKAKKT